MSGDALKVSASSWAVGSPADAKDAGSIVSVKGPAAPTRLRVEVVPTAKGPPKLLTWEAAPPPKVPA